MAPGIFDENEMKKIDPHYQEGVENGFEIAQDYFKKALKDFYKEIKRGRLKIDATTFTTTISEDYWEKEFDEKFGCLERASEDNFKNPIADIKNFIRKLLKEQKL